MLVSPFSMFPAIKCEQSTAWCAPGPARLPSQNFNNDEKNHTIIVIEDLKVGNMSRSAKGTTENPGTHVATKSGLNWSILNQGWGEFRRQLTYKQAFRGGEVLAVPAHHTSQTSPACQYVSDDNRKTQTRFECFECGFSENADLVGAINIKARGHRALACGESALAAR
jgi:putative transposase